MLERYERGCRPERLEEYSVARLASLRPGAPELRAEILRRFSRDVDNYVLEVLVPRIEGRGGKLRRDESDLYMVAVLDIVDWLAGRSMGDLLPNGARIAKDKAPRLRIWAESSALPLGGFLRGCYRDDDALRAWNRSRGLATRIHYTPRFARSDNELLLTEVRGGGGNQMREAFSLLEDRNGPLTASALLDALFRDACQPSPATVDLHRVLRRLRIDSEVENLSAASIVIARYEHHLAVRFPERYDNYLGRPREYTRRHSQLF